MRHQQQHIIMLRNYLISKHNDVLLLMTNKLSHHVNDHMYLLQAQVMQNNIKVTVSEFHLRIQEKATGHFLIRENTFAGYKMMACVLKMLTSVWDI